LLCSTIPWLVGCGLTGYGCYNLFVSGGTALGAVGGFAAFGVGSIAGAGAGAVVGAGVASLVCGLGVGTCLTGNLTFPGKAVKWLLCRPVLASCDPNEIQGPAGYGPLKMVAKTETLPYTILYENDPKFATTAAQKVIIRQPLDVTVNAGSIQLGSFGFGKYIFNVPAGLSNYTTTLNLADSIGFNVQFSAGLDVVNRQLIWVFQSIDPSTGLPPTDPYAGYLPVNDSTGKGEGFVSYNIRPARSTVTGDSIVAKAQIVFDINEPISTNTYVNIIDAVAPVSSIIANSLSVQQNAIISLSVQAADDEGGSGLKTSYDLYYSENGGAFVKSDSSYTSTTFSFIGNPGSTYCFNVIVTDNVGNIEPPKQECSIQVRLGGGPLPLTWLYFNAVQNNADVALNWSTINEVNAAGFAIQRSIDGRTFTNIGYIAAKGQGAVQATYRFIDAGVTSLNADRVYYRLKQEDKDGGFTYSHIVPIKLADYSTQMVVQALPNPFTTTLSVVIRNAIRLASATDKAELLTADGKLVYRSLIAGWINNGSLTLKNLPKLPQGVYILKVYIQNEVWNVKVVRK